MNSLEIEIHNLFQENPSIDYVSQELLSKYEKNETLSSLEVQGLSHFLIHTGHYDLLQKFYIKCLKQKKISQLPLGFIAELITKNQIIINEQVAAFFEYIIKIQPDEETSLQMPRLRQYSAEIAKKHSNIKNIFQTERTELKAKMILQLTKNRQLQMLDQEKSVLDQLISLFPNDIEVGLLRQDQLERKADEILSRFSSKKNLSKPKASSYDSNPETIKLNSDIENNLRLLSDKLFIESPDQLYNLSILTYQFDFFELTLEILEKTPESHSRNWLKAEVLYDSGRHLDLLKLIETLEQSSEALPDDTHGAVYLKALAYYGLGQKDLALRLLHSLARSVPFYRSTEALIYEWTHV